VIVQRRDRPRCIDPWVERYYPDCPGARRPETTGAGGGLGTNQISRQPRRGQAWLAHPVRGPRLQASCEAVLAVRGRSAHDIFGSPANMKLKSCATLFERVAPPASVFVRLRTLALPGSGTRRPCVCSGRRARGF